MLLPLLLLASSVRLILLFLLLLLDLAFLVAAPHVRAAGRDAEVLQHRPGVP